jgi:hypothetical protein
MSVSVPKFAISSQVARRDSIEVPILDPRDQKPTAITITLASPYSPQAKAAQHAIVEVLRGKKEADIGVAELEAKALDSLVACTLGWKGVEDADGNALIASASMVRALYDAEPWIAEQVQAAYGEKSRFFAPRTTG